MKVLIARHYQDENSFRDAYPHGTITKIKEALPLLPCPAESLQGAPVLGTLYKAVYPNEWLSSSTWRHILRILLKLLPFLSRYFQDREEWGCVCSIPPDMLTKEERIQNLTLVMRAKIAEVEQKLRLPRPASNQTEKQLDDAWEKASKDPAVRIFIKNLS